MEQNKNQNRGEQNKREKSVENKNSPEKIIK
jgi:hypothetical protein